MNGWEAPCLAPCPCALPTGTTGVPGAQKPCEQQPAGGGLLECTDFLRVHQSLVTSGACQRPLVLGARPELHAPALSALRRPPGSSGLPDLPPSARAQCPTRGRGSDSCQRRRRWRRPSVCAEEKPETDPFGSPSSPFPGPKLLVSGLTGSQFSTPQSCSLHSAALLIARPGGK